MTKEDIKSIIDIVHKTIYGFFDVCDGEETPIIEKDKLLLKINKAICNNIKALEQEPKICQWIIYDVHGHKACKCSECGIDVGYPCNDKYCPNCGAKMVEPQKSEE